MQAPGSREASYKRPVANNRLDGIRLKWWLSNSSHSACIGKGSGAEVRAGVLHRRFLNELVLVTFK